MALPFFDNQWQGAEPQKKLASGPVSSEGQGCTTDSTLGQSAEKHGATGVPQLISGEGWACPEKAAVFSPCAMSSLRKSLFLVVIYVDPY